MSIFRRFSDVFQQKANAAIDRAEDPAQALALSEQKQLDALQKARQAAVSFLTQEKTLELNAQKLRDQMGRCDAQAEQAARQSRDDLALQALQRKQLLQSQLTPMETQIEQLKTQAGQLDLQVQKLTAKIQQFRTQKTVLTAQYDAAKAATTVNSSITGLSEEFADAAMMADRAQAKITAMQARSQAIAQIADSGALGLAPGDDIDQQLQATVVGSGAQAELAAMKERLGLAAPAAEEAPRLGAAGIVVRISGETQYRLGEAARDALEHFDQDLVAAIEKNDEARFRGTLHGLLAFVRASGVELPPAEIQASDIVLPNEDMTLEEAHKIMGENGFVPPGSNGSAAPSEGAAPAPSA